MSYKPVDVGKFAPGSEVWGVIRRTGVGASESASILGVEGAFSTQLQIWGQKRGILVNEEPDDRLKDLFHFGQVMEPIIAKEFERRTKYAVMEDGHTYRHPEFPYIMATPDAWALKDQENCLLELKNISEWGASDWEEEPPAKYQVQLQHQMLVMGAGRGFLAAIVGGNRFVWWETTANEKFHRILIDKVTEFWQMVMDDIRPIGTGKDIEVLKGMHNVDPEKIVEFPAKVRRIDDELEAIKGTIKKLTKEKEGLEAKIWESLGDAEVGVFPGGGGYKIIQKQARRQEAYDVSASKYIRRFK